MPQKSSNQVSKPALKFYNDLIAKKIPLNTPSTGILSYEVIDSGYNHYFIKIKPPVYTPLTS